MPSSAITPFPAVPTAAESPPLTSITPSMVALPETRICTGVLSVLRWKRTVTPAGILMLV